MNETVVYIIFSFEKDLQSIVFNVDRSISLHHEASSTLERFVERHVSPETSNDVRRHHSDIVDCATSNSFNNVVAISSDIARCLQGYMWLDKINVPSGHEA